MSDRKTISHQVPTFLQYRIESRLMVSIDKKNNTFILQCTATIIIELASLADGNYSCGILISMGSK